MRPGGCVRASLTEQGYPVATVRDAGLVDAAGHDSFTAPYRVPAGRQSVRTQHSDFISMSAPVPAGQQGRPVWMGPRQGLLGGHSGRRSVRLCRIVAGRFPQRHLLVGQPSEYTTVSTAVQQHRTIWLAFDADSNGSGPEAARRLAAQLRGADITVRIVILPDGHDPNSFFAQGGDAGQFRWLLEASRP